MIVCMFINLSELNLMFGLLDRIPNGVDPMLQDLESYIVESGVKDMKSCAEIITSVSGTRGVWWGCGLRI